MNRQGPPGQGGADAVKAAALGAAPADALAGTVDRIGQDGFDRQLLAWLRQVVSFDSALVVIYAARQRPRILVDALDNPDRSNSAQHYLESAYLLDPFYLHARRSTESCLVQLRDIVPDDFSRSDYVETYYRRSAIKDEVNFLVPVDQATYAICVERSVREPAFSAGDLEMLGRLLPLVSALVRRHRALLQDRRDRQEPDREHLRLERILAQFGDTILTPREREVVGLMLRGYALAQIAERLKISLETARVHRRNIYDKLNIGSLAELFSCALAALAGGR
jgi:DNA-binding CsgD family transcriptional regulator